MMYKELLSFGVSFDENLTLDKHVNSIAQLFSSSQKHFHDYVSSMFLSVTKEKAKVESLIRAHI